MFPSRTLVLAAAACALAIPLAPTAWSQSQDDSGSITVTAPRSGQWSPDGTATETVSHAIKVSVSDLDMTTPAGQSAAESRIRAAAKKSCDWLDVHYPVTDSTADCVRGAVDAAMTRARALGTKS